MLRACQQFILQTGSPTTVLFLSTFSTPVYPAFQIAAKRVTPELSLQQKTEQEITMISHHRPVVATYHLNPSPKLGSLVITAKKITLSFLIIIQVHILQYLITASLISLQSPWQQELCHVHL